MDEAKDEAKDEGKGLLILTGLMGICVGVAWALQVLGFDGDAPGGRLIWTVASASVAGAGTGLILAAKSMRGALAKA